MSSPPDHVKHEHEQADIQLHEEASNLDPSNEKLSSQGLHRSASPVLPLPEIPVGGLSLELDLTSIIGSFQSNAEVQKVQKRASNVLKLSQENEKLKAELKAMSDRLEAAERRREELARKQQTIMDAPSS